jgi:hypothetical protein
MLVGDVGVDEDEVRMPSRDGVLRPFDAGLHDIESEVSPLFIQVTGQGSRHPSNPTPNVEYTVMWPKTSESLEMTKKLVAE